MPTYTGNASNNSWTVTDPGRFTIDGLGGVDSVHLGTSLRSSYNIFLNTDGSIQVDSVSSASGANNELHATLRNIELLYFNSDRDVLDLRIAFSDTTPPTITGFDPAPRATAVPVTSNIVVTFSEPIQRGSGSIILRDGIGNTLEWYDAASSSRLSINGNVLTIDPSTNLPPGISITLEITTGSLRDLTGNGVALSDSYGFSTVVNASDPRWSGTLGNDQFSVPAGALVADGLAGIDTLVFAQTRAAYTVQATLTGFNVVASNGSSNTQTTHVERLQFADPAPSANGHWALDFAGDGHAGTVAKILGAVFGPDSIHNAGYFGIGLKLMDDGMAYEPLMQLALDAAIGAGASNGAVVTLLYTNVVGVAPQPADLAYFVGLLDSHAFTPATLGILAADHSLNLGHIDLVGLAQTGIAYIPYAGG